MTPCWEYVCSLCDSDFLEEKNPKPQTKEKTKTNKNRKPKQRTKNKNPKDTESLLSRLSCVSPAMLNNSEDMEHFTPPHRCPQNTRQAPHLTGMEVLPGLLEATVCGFSALRRGDCFSVCLCVMCQFYWTTSCDI